MKGFFTPAVALSNRLSFSHKFTLILLLFMLPIGHLSLQSLMDANRRVHSTLTKLQGFALIQQLKPLPIQVADHRAGMAFYLNRITGRDASTQDQRLKALETEITTRLAQAAQQLRQVNRFATDTLTLQPLQQRFDALRIGQHPKDAQTNFKEHTQLIQQLTDLIRQIADLSGITLDPATDTKRLADLSAFHTLALQERIAQLRDKAAGAVADGILLEGERAALAQVPEMEWDALDSLHDTLWATLSNLPVEHQHLRTRLEPARADIEHTLEAFKQALNERVFGKLMTDLKSHEVIQLGSDVIAAISTLDSEAAALFINHSQQQVSAARSQRLLLILIVAGSVTLAIYLLLGISRAIRLTVNRMKDTAQALSRGDFSARFEITTRDDLGAMGGSLNDMIESVCNLLDNIQRANQAVTERASAQLDTMQRSRQQVEQQRQETLQVAHATTELAASIREVAGHCEAASASTIQVSTTTQQGKQVMDATVQTIHTLASSVEETAHTLNALACEADRIGEVVEVIRAIAEQTNLLALNAAIEAARAGEQGRGFAVVADEVRGLANRTQQSTEEIQSMVEALQHGSQQTVATAQLSRQHTERSVNQIQEAGQALERIQQEVQHIVALNTQIATATDQQSSAAAEISDSVTQLNLGADALAEQIQCADSHSRAMQTDIAQLQQAASRFNIG